MDQSGSLAKDKRSNEGKWINVYDQVQEIAEVLCSLKTLPTNIGNVGFFRSSSKFSTCKVIMNVGFSHCKKTDYIAMQIYN